MPAENAALANFEKAFGTGRVPPQTSIAPSTSTIYETQDMWPPPSVNQAKWNVSYSALFYPWQIHDSPEAGFVFGYPVRFGALRTSEGTAAFDNLILDEPAKQPAVIQIEQLREESELRLAQSIASRLTDLRNAQLEEEGEDIRSESLSDFISFIANYPTLRLPDVVLSPEGNIIAEWARGRGHLFSVHFLGNGQARVVIFVPDPSDERSTLRASSLALIGSVLLLARNYRADRWVLEE